MHDSGRKALRGGCLFVVVFIVGIAAILAFEPQDVWAIRLAILWLTLLILVTTLWPLFVKRDDATKG